jgi:molecular chaperone HtpG
MSTETIEFQAEARQLLQLMIHSIYSTKDVFLRELISNSSDALDKLRLAAYQDKDLEVDVSDLHIALETDPAERTLTVRDNGIGMTRDEVVELIGTIAKSGTADVLARLRQAREAGGASEQATAELIGQFGVGFYSSFMVADRVVLVTRKAGAHTGVRWESTGEGTYTVPRPPTPRRAPRSPCTSSRRTPRTRCTTTRTRRPSGRSSSGTRTSSPGPSGWPPPRARASRRRSTRARRCGRARPRTSPPRSTPSSTGTSATTGASRWRRSGCPPRAPSSTRRCCSCPATRRWTCSCGRARRGVQLYVKRVFIMDDCEALVPEYLRFVKGVVDAHDLSLNISREILQQDRQIQLIRKRLVKKVLATVKTMLDSEPEKYATFWSELGRAVKEGLISDHDNRPAILEICSIPTTHDAEKPTTLRDYLARMPEGQDAIYYVTGESRAALESSPHMEAFRAKGYEVLLLTDPVDEVWVEAVPSFDDKPFTSIAQGDVDLGGEEVDEDTRQGFEGLLTWMAGALAEDVKQVRLSHRLTTSAVCLVGDPGDMTPTLEKMYRAMGQEPPKVKRILELNPRHELVSGLRDAHRQRPDDAGLADTARLLHGMALLAEGGELAEPAEFVSVLSRQLAKTLD